MAKISKKEMLQARKGLEQLRGMLAEKQSKLKKEAGKMKGIAKTQESPDWVQEVMEEYGRAFHSEKPYRYYRVLNILNKHKIL